MNKENVLPLLFEKIRLNILIMFHNAIIAGFLGGYEWIVIVLVVVLLFGGRKIPELAKGLGKGIKEFKNASKELKDEVNETDANASEEK